MKSNHTLIVVFSLLPFLINANIWDNLFLGQGVYFKLPPEFYMELSTDQEIGKMTLQVIGSAAFNTVSIKQGFSISPMFDSFTGDVLDYKFNFTAGTLFLHSPIKECVAVKDDKLDVDDFYQLISGYISLGTLLLSKQKDGEYSKLSGKDLVDTISINRTIPDIELFFDNQDNLKKIKVEIPEYLELPEYPPLTLEVVRIEPYVTIPEEFIVPEEWHCENEEFKKLNEIDPEEFFEEIKKGNLEELLEEIKKSNPSLDPEELIEEIKRINPSLDPEELFEEVRKGNTSVLDALKRLSPGLEIPNFPN